MKLIKDNKTIGHLVIFATVALASGWVGLFIDRQLTPQTEGETLGMGMWLILPLVSAVILTLLKKEGWKYVGLRLNLNGNLKWYGYALIIFPVVTCFVTLLGKMLSWVDVSRFNSATYFAGFVAALLPNLIKNFFEEFVWRGYLTGNLVGANFADFRIYLIVGGIWGVWHVPYYLYFLPDSMIEQVLPIGRLPFALIALITMICWTVMYVELYRITKSIWPVVFLHMVEDATINHLIIDHHILIQSGKELLISPIIGCITSVIYLIIGLCLRKARLAIL